MILGCTEREKGRERLHKIEKKKSYIAREGEREREKERLREACERLLSIGCALLAVAFVIKSMLCACWDSTSQLLEAPYNI